MATLFSYCIPYDDGAAPNPFWGVCTLAICKPRIRTAANIGDWIVGTGSTKSPIGDISGQVVYAMLVTQKMTMKEYDQFTRSKLPHKLPQINHPDPRRWCGDSIYDFSTITPTLRPSVHTKKNQHTDLSGQFVLLSTHFYYFGDQPVPLPESLRDIVQQRPGHRSHRNAPYIDDFVHWLEDLTYPDTVPMGNPQWKLLPNFQTSCIACANGRRQEAEDDLAESDTPLNNPC